MPSPALRLSLPVFAISLSTSWAQEKPAKPEVVTLPEVVITATRTEVSPLRAPSAVRVIDGQAMDRMLVRTVPEALLETPGVLVQKTSNGQGSPFVRGFTGYRTLALMDGIRLNNSIMRDGPNEYWGLLDPYTADRLELVAGPGSVLYGSDAVGGVLNFLTKSSGFESEPAGASFAHGSAFYRYHSSENSHAGRMEARFGKGGKYGVQLGATLRDFGNIHAADYGDLPNTGYQQWAYDGRLDVKLSDTLTFSLAHQQLDQSDAWRTHSTTSAVSFAGSTVGTDLSRILDHNRTLSYAKLAAEDMDGWVKDASLTLSYQTLEETQRRVKGDKKSEIGGLDVATWGLDLQLQSDTPVGTLTYGVEYYHDEVDSNRTDYKTDGSVDAVRIQGPVGDDASYDVVGAYLQDEIKLGESTTLYLGGRYSHARAEIGKFEDPVTKTAESFDGSWNQFTASARLTQSLNDKETVLAFAGVGQSFRAPNLSDLSRLDVARSGELETAATDLEPEKFLSYEIGLKGQTEKTTWSATYFYTQIDDLIVRTPTGRTVGESKEVTKRNGAEGYIQGVELAAEYEFAKGWSIFGNATWQEGEADTFPTSDREMVREPISRIAPLMGTLGVRWTADSGKFWSEVVCTAADKADKLNTADAGDTQRIPPGGTPGYTLLGVRAGWQITDNVLVLASLENLLDEAYRTHGSGTNEPGIGGSVGVKISF